jgi:D-tagatose-1,6-bisphosphate aldolase subunit GatZ/KbaZ
MPPVYIVGSEVPIPGGTQDEEEGLKVTSVNDFEETVDVFREMFLKNGLNEAWNNVVAVVVQPGVEFGDETVHEYRREEATALSSALKKYNGLVFEGHSTDYQTAEALRQMVEDGIAILKVGPALTYALREGLFMLAHMEKELLADKPEYKLSNFIEVLDGAMVSQPGNWKKHYHGTESKIRFARKYSLSDRCRYYLPVPEVKASLELLVANLKKAGIPLTLVSQFMPVQYKKIRDGMLENDPEALLKDRVDNLLDDYYYAVSAVKA